MNKIIYAGKDEQKIKELMLKRRYWQFIRCNAKGEVRSGKATEPFYKSDVLAVPPLTEYSRSGENVQDIHIFMEGAALPFKAPRAIHEEFGGGFYHAFLQAEAYFAVGGEKNAPVLAALGDLIVGYIIAQTERAVYSPVVESIRADIGANVSNSSYALVAFLKSMPLNYDYLRKLFKSETGATPHEYLLKLRMELASQVILSGMSNQYSRFSVSQIAEMCGFAEPLYFSRVFKKYYGMPPSDYGK